MTIYHLSIRSELKFERSEYAESLTDLATRRYLLTTLSSSAKGSYDQALAVEFIDAYDPLIRFCAYKLGRAESHDIEGVVRDVDEEMMEESIPGYKGLVEGLKGELGAEEVEKGRKELEDVEFGGEKVELRSAEIVGVMLKVQEALGKLKGKEGVKGKGGGMKGWDRVLSVLGEAEGVAKRLLEDHQVRGS
jgi:signal recognition particle subunit SRP68